MICANCGKKLEKPSGVCSTTCLEEAMLYDRNLNKEGKEYADQEHQRLFTKSTTPRANKQVSNN